MSEKSPTPDMLPRFNRHDRFDDAPGDVGGRSLAKEIDRNTQGPHCKLDGPASGMGQPREEFGGDLRGAARSIPSGAKAPKVDWSRLKKG